MIDLQSLLYPLGQKDFVLFIKPKQKENVITN
jgi:hypothetical protein